MDAGQQKEQFSVAYVHAVVTAAGFAVYWPTVDDDSIDIGIAARGVMGSRRSPRLELQLKCTEKSDWHGDNLHFVLKLKNYRDLQGDDLVVPRILVVVVVPEDLSLWLKHSEEELALRKCGYWLSLRKAASTGNTSSVVVKLPKRQQFTIEAVKQIMHDIAGGNPP